MSNEKIGFTEGPWKFVTRSYRDYEHFRIGTDQKVIAVIKTEHKGFITREESSNARLIACSPELFNIVEGILNAWSIGKFDTLASFMDDALLIQAKIKGITKTDQLSSRKEEFLKTRSV